MQAHNASFPLILLVFANDTTDYLEQIQQEKQLLHSILQPVANRLEYDLEIQEYTTFDELIDYLDSNRDRLIMLHFAGHSNGELLKLDEGVAYASGLKGKLHACQHLRFLFLNGCNSAGQVDQFVEIGIQSIIGTNDFIRDDVALKFSEAFYKNLAALENSITVGEAYEQAKSTVKAKYDDSFEALNRSFDLGGDKHTPQEWPWFLKPENEQNWKLEYAAHPCNRLPVLPNKALLDLPDEPFKNLYYYQPDDADIFFGRCQSTLDVLEQLDKPDTPLLLLHGGTGVGKSSFLMAGLIPRLLARQQVVNDPFRYDEQVTLQNLRQRIFNTNNIEEIHKQLDSAGTHPSIWILDQIEEIFYKTDDKPDAETEENSISKEEKQDSIPDVLNLLLKTLSQLYPAGQTEQWPNARIILSLRTEWFGKLHDACRHYQLTSQDYLLKPLSKQGIIEAIEQPATKPLLINKYSLQIQNPADGRLAEQIADDLLEDKESNIAPPLQIMLSKLWQSVADRPKEQRIWTQALYEEKKKQGLLLSEHLDQQLLEIGELSNKQYGNWGKESNESGLLLDVLHAHTTPQGTSKTLTSTEYETHYAHIPYRNQLARVLTDRYLLIDPLNNNQQRRLAHDTLAQVVKAKYETSDLVGQRARRILDSRKTDWELTEEGNPEGTPLDDYDLKLVEQGQLGTYDWNYSNNGIEIAIVEKSQKRRRNARFIRAGVILGFILAFIFTIFFYLQAKDQKEIAEDKVRRLEANKLAVQSAKISDNKEKYYYSWSVGGWNNNLSPPSFIQHLQLAKEAINRTLLKDNAVTRESFDALRKAVYATPPWYDFIDLNNVEPVALEF